MFIIYTTKIQQIYQIRKFLGNFFNQKRKFFVNKTREHTSYRCTPFTELDFVNNKNTSLLIMVKVPYKKELAKQLETTLSSFKGHSLMPHSKSN